MVSPPPCKAIIAQKSAVVNRKSQEHKIPLDKSANRTYNGPISTKEVNRMTTEQEKAIPHETQERKEENWPMAELRAIAAESERRYAMRPKRKFTPEEIQAIDAEDIGPNILDTYEHYGYVEIDPLHCRYQDDGFPSGEYFTASEGGIDTLRRMVSVLGMLNPDKKIRAVFDYDPDYPVSMVRYWGTRKDDPAEVNRYPNGKEDYGL